MPLSLSRNVSGLGDTSSYISSGIVDRFADKFDNNEKFEDNPPLDTAGPGGVAATIANMASSEGGETLEPAIPRGDVNVLSECECPVTAPLMGLRAMEIAGLSPIPPSIMSEESPFLLTNKKS